MDTTVQEKAVAHPSDARLMHRAIEKLVLPAEVGARGWTDANAAFVATMKTQVWTPHRRLAPTPQQR